MDKGRLPKKKTREGTDTYIQAYAFAYTYNSLIYHGEKLLLCFALHEQKFARNRQ